MRRSHRSLVLALTVAALLAAPAVALADEEPQADDGKAEKRARINEVADEALAELLATSDGAASLYESAYGHAVFDNWKFAFGISGGGGTGVAVEKAGGTRTYMKMGTGGIGLGLGGQKYQLIVMFETQEAFDRFVTSGWQADTQASAAAGTKGASAGASFHNGVAIFQVTESGLLANADITGTKFWKHKKLN